MLYEDCYIGRNNFLGSIFLLLFLNTLQLVSLLGNKIARMFHYILRGSHTCIIVINLFVLKRLSALQQQNKPCCVH